MVYVAHEASQSEFRTYPLLEDLLDYQQPCSMTSHALGSTGIPKSQIAHKSTDRNRQHHPTIVSHEQQPVNNRFSIETQYQGTPSPLPQKKYSTHMIKKL